ALTEKVHSFELAIKESKDLTALQKEIVGARDALAKKDTASSNKDEELVNLRNAKASLKKELYDSLDKGTSPSS
ncbi:hypothetical protein A2U01_0104611, partial [Trifolium medium]|nr:hypothetical protein [Trifolium medium]